MQVQCFEGHFVMVLSRFRLFVIRRESTHSLQGKEKTYLSTNQKNDYGMRALYPLPNPQGSLRLLGTFSLAASGWTGCKLSNE